MEDLSGITVQGLEVHQGQGGKVQAGLEPLGLLQSGCNRKAEADSGCKLHACHPGTHFFQLGNTSQMLHKLPKQNHQLGNKSSHTGAHGRHSTSKPQQLTLGSRGQRAGERTSPQDGSQQRTGGMDRTKSSLRRRAGGKLAAAAGF